MQTRYATMADMVGGFSWASDLTTFDEAVHAYVAYRDQDIDATIMRFDINGACKAVDVTRQAHAYLEELHNTLERPLPAWLADAGDVLEWPAIAALKQEAAS